MKLAGKNLIFEIFGLKNPQFWPKIAKTDFLSETWGRRDLLMKCKNDEHKILHLLQVPSFPVGNLVPEILACFDLCYESAVSLLSLAG